MDKDLHILQIEDVTTDAELMERELRKAKLSFVVRRVETRDAFLKELKEFPPDLILSDYSLPLFDGMTALRLARIHAPRTPFIVVTGSINEVTAVECMKAGAADYVLKDRLVRLGSAVRAALDKKRAEEKLQIGRASCRERV